MLNMWIDVVLLLGLTLRLTRLVTADHLGDWLIRDEFFAPMTRWANIRDPEGYPATWRQKLWMGLNCPFCVGFWIGTATLASFYLWHGDTAWRLVAGAFTLNYVVGHMSARLD